MVSYTVKYITFKNPMTRQELIEFTYKKYQISVKKIVNPYYRILNTIIR
jgi:hypothetical protein